MLCFVSRWQSSFETKGTGWIEKDGRAVNNTFTSSKSTLNYNTWTADTSTSSLTAWLQWWWWVVFAYFCF